MIERNTIRAILNRSMEKGRLYSLQEIYTLIPEECLDAEDFLPSADPPKGNDLRWMHRVRGALQAAKEKGHIYSPSRKTYIRRCILS